MKADRIEVLVKSYAGAILAARVSETVAMTTASSRVAAIYARDSERFAEAARRDLDQIRSIVEGLELLASEHPE